MIRSIAISGLMLWLTTTSGCSSYLIAIDEFDSLAGWDDPHNEPATAEYRGRARLYDWWNWFAWSEPALVEVERPSADVRGLVVYLAAAVASDLTSVAQVSRRLLWVAQKDPNPFNRIQALQGIERIMVIMDIDPLDEAAYPIDLEPAKQAQEKLALGVAQTKLRALFGRPAVRVRLTAAERREYIAALRSYTARPLSRLRTQRDLIRVVWSTYVRETDPAVVEAASVALRRAIRFAVCNGLRAGLVAEDYGAKDLPVVRTEVLMIYRRLGGARAVPFLLSLLARPESAPAAQRFDRDPGVRMVLVRMSAQLRPEQALRRVAPGPAPAEFLYYVATDEAEDDGLRRVALEGLARCLADKLELHRIPRGDQWARDWWKRHVVAKGA